jgi:hypothetical protein
MAGCLLRDSEIKNPVPGRVWIMAVTCNQCGPERVSKVCTTSKETSLPANRMGRPASRDLSLDR